MKITKKQLKQLIKEEVANLEEAQWEREHERLPGGGYGRPGPRKVADLKYGKQAPEDAGEKRKLAKLIGCNFPHEIAVKHLSKRPDDLFAHDNPEIGAVAGQQRFWFECESNPDYVRFEENIAERKITKEQLQKLIKEELKNILTEEGYDTYRDERIASGGPRYRPPRRAGPYPGTEGRTAALAGDPYNNPYPEGSTEYTQYEIAYESAAARGGLDLNDALDDWAEMRGHRIEKPDMY